MMWNYITNNQTIDQLSYQLAFVYSLLHDMDGA